MHNRFTVCPLWPLGNSPIFTSLSTCAWSWWTDSNPRPADYKSAALPAELHQQLSRNRSAVSTMIIIADGAWFVKGFFTFSGVFLLFFGTWAESPRETGGGSGRALQLRVFASGRGRAPRPSAADVRAGADTVGRRKSGENGGGSGGFRRSRRPLRRRAAGAYAVP